MSFFNTPTSKLEKTPTKPRKKAPPKLPLRSSRTAQNYENLSESLAPESTNITIIKKLIKAYFQIVQRNLIDYVPKTIITLLVNESTDILEKELVSSIYGAYANNLDSFLAFDQNIGHKRNELEYELKVLDRCTRILDEFEDSNF
jgi:hypothetical protein